MDHKSDNDLNEEEDHWGPILFLDSYDLKLLQEVIHSDV